MQRILVAVGRIEMIARLPTATLIKRTEIICPIPALTLEKNLYGLAAF
jgi:hypothetical protein